MLEFEQEGAETAFSLVSERRKRYRIKMILKVVCVKRGENKPFQLMTENLSAMGIKFVCHRQLEVDAMLVLKIMLRRPFAPFVAEGRVVWCDRRTASSKTCYEGGIDFTSISEPDKIGLERFTDYFSNILY